MSTSDAYSHVFRLSIPNAYYQRCVLQSGPLMTLPFAQQTLEIGLARLREAGLDSHIQSCGYRALEHGGYLVEIRVRVDNVPQSPELALFLHEVYLVDMPVPHLLSA